jgi:general stress protein CsbA
MFIALLGVVCVLTPLLVLGGFILSFGSVLGILAALAVVCLVAVWPLTGFYLVAGCAILVEEEPLPTPILTDRLNIFYWPAGYEGQVERPIGFLMIFILLSLVTHRLVSRQRLLAGGALLGPFLFFLLFVTAGIVHGSMTGGNLKITVVELRPIEYLFLSYLLAYNLLTQMRHLRAFLWLSILGAGVKALQGIYIYVVILHGDLTGHHDIMAHEESFFFVALLLLAVLFCLHYRYIPQLVAALVFLPFVLVALVANQRRADYVALALGLAVVWVLAAWMKPRARTAFLVSLLVCAVLCGGYVIGFSRSTAAIAQPAREIFSVFQAGPGDGGAADSNQYRAIENFDLTYTAKQNPLGLGFGKQFLQPIMLTNISALDPYYLYVPHNTLYWIWMRLGAMGFFALLYLFGAIIVRGTLIARQLRDPYLQLIAIYVVAVTFMEVIVAIADYQLFSFRTVIYFGLLTGIVAKLPEMDRNKEAVAFSSAVQMQSPIKGRLHGIVVSKRMRDIFGTADQCGNR